MESTSKSIDMSTTDEQRLREAHRYADGFDDGLRAARSGSFEPATRPVAVPSKAKQVPPVDARDAQDLDRVIDLKLENAVQRRELTMPEYLTIRAALARQAAAPAEGKKT